MAIIVPVLTFFLIVAFAIVKLGESLKGKGSLTRKILVFATDIFDAFLGLG